MERTAWHAWCVRLFRKLRRRSSPVKSRAVTSRSRRSQRYVSSAAGDLGRFSSLARMKLTLRLAAKWLWTRLLFITGALWWAERYLGSQAAIIVLTFHRVLTDGALERSRSLPGTIIRQRTFERLAQSLARSCDLVDLAAGLPDWGEAARKPRVALTFDDGWTDTATVALPIAQKYGVPIAIFVCPELVGRQLPFWPERAVAL